MLNRDYLSDKRFLRQLDLEERKTQYIRIAVLDFQTENVIANIEGKATGGTVNLNGSSFMRRTMSCSLAVDPNGLDVPGYQNSIQYGNITEVQNLISMNKKIRVEIGFENTLRYMGDAYYPDYDIIWIPLGVYVIKAANVSKSTGGINISLTLNDKAALLNGDMGGTIPAATIFSEEEIYNADITNRSVEKILIKDMIKHIVVDFGGERPENVIITDIPDTIVKVVKWSGTESLYLVTDEGGGKRYSYKEDGKETIRTFSFGEDVGYMNADFVYPGKLECNAGETVSSVLDKIKNTLGNHEWFYDINGRFVFQEKKNYLNTAQSQSIYNSNEEGYLSELNMSKEIYTFDANNRKLLTNISSNPQYLNVKNDFIVWGVTKTATGSDKPIRYHLAFDKKPAIRTDDDPRLGIVYTDFKGLQQVSFNISRLFNNAEKADKTKYYYTYDNNEYKVIFWDEDLQNFRVYPDVKLCYLSPGDRDWRTELYYRGLEAEDKSFSKNYYSAELNSEWPKICNVLGEEYDKIGGIPCYKSEIKRDLKESNYEYYLDFIEGSEGGSRSLSQFSVDNIGRRTKIENDKATNCIFAEELPPYRIENPDGDVIIGDNYITVEEEIYDKMVIGGGRFSAYDRVKELIIQHTGYNESVTLTTIPIYYLEPNNIISIQDSDVGVNGNYLINTISLPLTFGTSNISCTKSLEKTI